MLYFAYGSNMDWQQMRQRCPSARFQCIAVLADHKLAFTRFSKGRGCGVADCTPSKGSRVWGVVYQVDEADIGSLDKHEGYRPGGRREDNCYVREERHVWRDAKADDPVAVQVYFAIPQEGRFLPNGDYRQLLVNGAKSWHLPSDYMAELEAIEVR